jgi:hypothetical protein
MRRMQMAVQVANVLNLPEPDMETVKAVYDTLSDQDKRQFLALACDIYGVGMTEEEHRETLIKPMFLSLPEAGQKEVAMLVEGLYQLEMDGSS